MANIVIPAVLLAALLAAGSAGAATLVPYQPPPERVAQGQGAGEGAPKTRVPERTETTNIGNWAVTCDVYSDAPKQKSCRAQLRAQQAQDQRIILVWTIFINAQKQLVGVIETLTGVAILPGVDLHIEAGKQSKATDWSFAYQDCEPVHCHAVRLLDEKFIREAAAASAVTAIIRANTGETVRINFPIEGFGKAYAQLRASAG